MPRDNPEGSSSRCSAAREVLLSRCTLTAGSHRTIDPHALKIPAPEGRNLHLRRTSLLHFTLSQDSPPDRQPDEPERKAAYAFISGNSRDKDSLAVETVKTFLEQAGFAVERYGERELRIRHGAKKAEA